MLLQPAAGIFQSLDEGKRTEPKHGPTQMGTGSLSPVTATIPPEPAALRRERQYGGCPSRSTAGTHPGSDVESA